MAKVYVVTVFDSGDGTTKSRKVIENEFEAYDYAARLNREWVAKGDHSEATVSEHEFESKFEKALKEIIAIAEPHAEFTVAYERICKIAREALEGTK